MTSHVLHSRHQQIFRSLWLQGPLSQSQLHKQLGLRKNTVSEDVAEMLRQGLIREGDVQRRVRGRPRTLLEIDPVRRHVLGLSIQAGRVELAGLNLLGEMRAPPVCRAVRSLSGLVSTAQVLLSARVNDQTLAVGLATPGIIDSSSGDILLSVLDPAGRSRQGVSLRPLMSALAPVPLIVENDVHAMAARWMLSQRQRGQETVLLVFLEDGQIGAALLVEGHSTPGCVIGAHELGHTRLQVETERCYCGKIGCLERIFSNAFLQRQGLPVTGLADAVVRFSDHAVVGHMLELVGSGVANAINLLRPHRLVLVSGLARNASFANTLIGVVRQQMLGALAPRVQIDLWNTPAPRSAETAGWLALASLYRSGWDTAR